MRESRAQAMAFIAEAIHRTTGVTVDDMHLGIGLAMCDQVSGVKPHRATQVIKKLNQFLGSRRERSIAAALPVLFLARFEKRDVCVIVASDDQAREDAELYATLLADLDAPTRLEGVPGRRLLSPRGTGHAPVIIATPDGLAEGPSHHAVLVSRLSPSGTKGLRRQLPGTAGLPEV